MRLNLLSIELAKTLSYGGFIFEDTTPFGRLLSKDDDNDIGHFVQAVFDYTDNIKYKI